jgi:hypothetical protein
MRAFRSVNCVAVLLAALGGGGCATAPLEPWPGHTPLVPRIELRVGTFFASAARLAALRNELVNIDFGKESVARFERVFASLFTGATEVPDWPPWREVGTAMDGVIELEQASLTVQPGHDGGGAWVKAMAGPNAGKPDVVAVAFRICLYRPDASVVACWNPSVTARHQREPFECLDLRECVVPQVSGAVREAIARFMVDIGNDPAVQAWVAEVQRR